MLHGATAAKARDQLAGDWRLHDQREQPPTTVVHDLDHEAVVVAPLPVASGDGASDDSSAGVMVDAGSTPPQLEAVTSNVISSTAMPIRGA